MIRDDIHRLGPSDLDEWALVVLGVAAPPEGGFDPLGTTLPDFVDQLTELRFVSPSIRGILGYTQDELARADLLALVHPDDLVLAGDEYVRVLGDEPIPRPISIRAQHRDGHWIGIDVVITNMLADPSVRAIVANVRRSVRPELDEHRAGSATPNDELTGLASRAHFVGRLQAELDRTSSAPEDGMVAVLYVAVDDLRLLVDSYGYEAGDEHLAIVAERLRDVTLPTDLVARFASDAFTILRSGVRARAEVDELARVIADVLAQPARIGAGEVIVGTSIGVALQDSSTHDASALIWTADGAAPRTAARGPSGPRAGEERRAHAEEHVRLGALLHHAVERTEFVLHYQPLVALDTGSIVAVEALLRWERPGYGLVAPASFIRVAEETGLITPIGRWAFAEACRQLATWQRMPGLAPNFAVKVNLSARQLDDDALLDDLIAIMAHTGIEPARMWAEITENSIMDVPAAITVLARLRAAGVHLAIDDFGTGYSSMSHLKRLPVEALKIDQSFVAGLGTDPDDTAIVTACIVLARELGFTSIAEGIETTTQLTTLRELGCQIGQGRLFAHPCPPEQLADLPPDDHAAWSTARAYPLAGC